jgi:predicted  nucleic acid-binding Zn-ribbon protein
MAVTKLDQELYSLFKNLKAGHGDLEKIKALLEALCKELKALWKEKKGMDDLVHELINDCALLATRPLEEYEWDEMKVDHLKTLFSMAESAKEFRYAVSWADRSKKFEVRRIHNKLETEKDLFFLNEDIKHLDGMAFSLLRWLNTRNTLLNAYRNR